LRGLPERDPELAFRIADEGVPILESRRYAFADFKKEAFLWYIDTAPLRRMMKQALYRRIRSGKWGAAKLCLTESRAWKTESYGECIEALSDAAGIPGRSGARPDVVHPLLPRQFPVHALRHPSDTFIEVRALPLREKPNLVGRVLMQNRLDDRLVRDTLAFCLFPDRSEVGSRKADTHHRRFLVALQFSAQTLTLRRGDRSVLIRLIFDALLVRIEP
jgi:hypothetical protein